MARVAAPWIGVHVDLCRAMLTNAPWGSIVALVWFFTDAPRAITLSGPGCLRADVVVRPRRRTAGLCVHRCRSRPNGRLPARTSGNGHGCGFARGPYGRPARQERMLDAGRLLRRLFVRDRRPSARHRIAESPVCRGNHDGHRNRLSPGHQRVASPRSTQAIGLICIRRSGRRFDESPP